MIGWIRSRKRSRGAPVVRRLMLSSSHYCRDSARHAFNASLLILPLHVLDRIDRFIQIFNLSIDQYSSIVHRLSRDIIGSSYQLQVVPNQPPATSYLPISSAKSSAPNCYGNLLRSATISIARHLTSSAAIMSRKRPLREERFTVIQPA